MPEVYVSKNQAREAKIRKIIDYAKAEGIQKQEMKDALGISNAAFYRKRSSPGMFTMNEIWKLCDFLHVPDEKRLEILK